MPSTVLDRFRLDGRVAIVATASSGLGVVVDRVLPGDELHPAAQKFVQRLAAGPSQAFSVLKVLVRAYGRDGVPAADALLLKAAVGLFDTEDARARVEAFLG